MVEDATVSIDRPSISVALESTNEGKMYNENNCMPARSINIYDDFIVNSYNFILYGRGFRSEH